MLLSEADVRAQLPNNHAVRLVLAFFRVDVERTKHTAYSLCLFFSHACKCDREYYLFRTQSSSQSSTHLCSSSLISMHSKLQLLCFSFSSRERRKEILSTLDWNTRWNDQPRFVVLCRSKMARFLLSVYIKLCLALAICLIGRFVLHRVVAQRSSPVRTVP